MVGLLVDRVRGDWRWQTWVSVTRLVGFALLSAWIVGGPLYKQVLGGKTRWVRTWVMFGNTGKGAVAARFETVDEAGERSALDHFELLEQPRPYSFDERPHKSAWMIHSKGQFDKLVKRICRKLGRGADLRAEARIARGRGWKRLENGDRNMCAPKPKPKPNPKLRRGARRG